MIYGRSNLYFADSRAIEKRQQRQRKESEKSNRSSPASLEVKILSLAHICSAGKIRLKFKLGLFGGKFKAKSYTSLSIPNPLYINIIDRVKD